MIFWLNLLGAEYAFLEWVRLGIVGWFSATRKVAGEENRRYRHRRKAYHRAQHM